MEIKCEYNEWIIMSDAITLSQFHQIILRQRILKIHCILPHLESNYVQKVSNQSIVWKVSTYNYMIEIKETWRKTIIHYLHKLVLCTYD